MVQDTQTNKSGLIGRRSKEAKEQASLIKTITDNASLALFLMNDRQHCTFMNPAAERLTGYTLAEVQGAPLHNYIHHKHPDGSPYPLSECPIDRALPKNNREQGEEVFVHKDGSFYPVGFTASPIIENGIPIGTVIEARNLTKEKETQQILRENKERLNLLAEQRKQLMQINEAKDEFISVASHQLRTPATGVKQYIGMLLEGYAGELTDEQLTMLRTAYDSNERQLTIVNDLLRVAHVDAGRVKLRKCPTDLAQMLSSVIEEQMSSIVAREQTITLETPAQKITANVDPERMRMVLENLIDNASKYSPLGRHIEVRVLRDDTIDIEIKDQGVGIAKEDIDKLFRKFYRINNPLSTDVGGSGLGLYWVRKIIDLHGGEITVSSQLDKGTTFVISLPV